MYDRILIPLDGSAFSAQIIPHATGMALAHKTPVALLRVVDDEAQRTVVAPELTELAARFDAMPLCIVAGGDAADAILREAGQVPRTLVAMTSRGHSGLLEAVLGSVALRVVRASPLPVLVYSPQAEDASTEPVKVNRVVLPLDGGEISEAMIPVAAELARWLGAGLSVVSVIDPRELARATGMGADKSSESVYVRSSAARIQKEHGLEVDWETLNDERPADAIGAYVRNHPGTVLTMATHGRSAVRSAFLGSVTSDCLRKGGVPVLMRVP